MPSTPAAVPSAQASSAMRTRSVCQGSTGSASPSSAASRRTTSGPAPWSAASVPAAPPSWTARRPSRTLESPARASSTATVQPAARRPNVVGSACWSRVRATARVSRCASARAAQPSATAARSPSTAPSACRASSISAVSTTSWLVAPWWRWGRAVPRGERRDPRPGRAPGSPCSTRAAADVVDVEVHRGAGGGDLGGGGGGDHPRPRAGGGERRLDLEHRAEPGAVRHQPVDRGRAEERADQASGGELGRLRARRRRSHRRPGGGCRSAAAVLGDGDEGSPVPGGRRSRRAPGRRRSPRPRRGNTPG